MKRSQTRTGRSMLGAMRNIAGGMKNWRSRYFVLKDGALQVGGGAHGVCGECMCVCVGGGGGGGGGCSIFILIVFL
jgi:hypothetical protein